MNFDGWKIRVYALPSATFFKNDSFFCRTLSLRWALFNLALFHLQQIERKPWIKMPSLKSQPLQVGDLEMPWRCKNLACVSCEWYAHLSISKQSTSPIKGHNNLRRTHQMSKIDTYEKNKLFIQYVLSITKVRAPKLLLRRKSKYISGQPAHAT